MLSTPGVSSLLSLQIWICKKGLMVSSVVLICTCEVCQTVSSGHGEQRKACLPLKTALRGCQRACLAVIITCKCSMVLKWAVQELLEKGMPVLLWIHSLSFSFFFLLFLLVFMFLGCHFDVLLDESTSLCWWKFYGFTWMKHLWQSSVLLDCTQWYR